MVDAAANISVKLIIGIDTEYVNDELPFFLTVYMNEVSGRVIYENLDTKQIGRRSTSVNDKLPIHLNIFPTLTSDGVAMHNAYIGFQLYNRTRNEWGEVTSQPVGSSFVYLQELKQIYRYFKAPTDKWQGNFSIGDDGRDRTYALLTRQIVNHQCKNTSAGTISIRIYNGDIKLSDNLRWKSENWSLSDATSELAHIRSKSIQLADLHMQSIHKRRLKPAVDYLDNIHLATYETNMTTLPGDAFLVNTPYILRRGGNTPCRELRVWLLDIVSIAVERTYRTKEYYVRAFRDQMKSGDVLRDDFVELTHLLSGVIHLYDNTLPYDDDYGYIPNDKGDGGKCRFNCERMEVSTNRRSEDCEDSCGGCLAIYYLLEELDSICDLSGEYELHEGSTDILLHILALLAKYMYVPCLCLSAVSRKAVRSKKQCFAAHIHPYLIPMAFFLNNLHHHGHLNKSQLTTIVRERNDNMTNDMTRLMSKIEHSGVSLASWKGVKVPTDGVDDFEYKLRPVIVDGTGLVDGKLSPLRRYYDGSRLQTMFRKAYIVDAIQYQMETIPLETNIDVHESKRTSLESDETFDVCKKVMVQTARVNGDKATRLYKWCTTFMTNKFLKEMGWVSFLLVQSSAESNRNHEGNDDTSSKHRHTSRDVRSHTSNTCGKYGVKYSMIENLNSDNFELMPMNSYTGSNISWLVRASLYSSIPRSLPKPYTGDTPNTKPGESLLRLNNDITPMDVSRSFTRARNEMHKLSINIIKWIGSVSRGGEKIKTSGGIYTNVHTKEITITFFYVINDVSVTTMWTTGFMKAIKRVNCARLCNISVTEEKYSRESIGFRIDLSWMPTGNLLRKCAKASLSSVDT